jgi:hypothetical protein
VAGQLNLEIDAGSYWSYTITWKDSAGNPVDLTGYQAQMQARPSVDSATVEFSLATPGNSLIPAPDGQITLGGVDGTLLLELPASASSARGVRSRRSFSYDLEVVPPNGKTLRLLEGYVILTPEVTREA